MKKGIALLVTLGFITILTTIIAYMFSVSKENFQKIEKIDSRNQSAILYKDGKIIVDKFVKKIKNSDDLDRFLSKVSPFIYQSKEGSLHVEVIPLSNKININSLVINNIVNKNTLDFIKSTCSFYNILDSKFFIDLLLDTIDEDDIARQAQSEILIKNKKFSNSKIVNYNHLKAIMSYYVSVTNDKNILQIPWEKLVFFGSMQKEMLDCDRMSDDLERVLGLDFQSFKGCSDLVGVEAIQIAQKYSLKKFTKANNYYILVKIFYSMEEFKNRILFVYNIKDNKVSNIELF